MPFSGNLVVDVRPPRPRFDPKVETPGSFGILADSRGFAGLVAGRVAGKEVGRGAAFVVAFVEL
jgi:hypothetical protein